MAKRITIGTHLAVLLVLGTTVPALAHGKHSSAQGMNNMSMAPLPGNNTAEAMGHVNRAIEILNEIDRLIDANTERNNRLRAEYQQRVQGGTSGTPAPANP